MGLSLAFGCSDDPGNVSSFGDGGSGSAASTTGGGSAVTTSGGSASTTGEDDLGYTPDDEVCIAHGCTEAKNCCVGDQPLLDSACPGGLNYPNNWSCVSGFCVHGGCTSDTDCLVPGLECETIGGIGRCVALCNDDDDCTRADDPDNDGLSHAMAGTECRTDDSIQYCRQPLP